MALNLAWVHRDECIVPARRFSKIVDLAEESSMSEETTEPRVVDSGLIELIATANPAPPADESDEEQ